MKQYEVSNEVYNLIRLRFAGLVFHRVDESGKFFVKPLKCIEPIVSKLAIN